ncbi:MAG: NAD-dependent epimerase/dehydratase family protein [Hominimerdicola sp.]
MSNILITGASGMIGLSLTKNLLTKKHSVYAVDAIKNELIGTDPNYHFTQCDVTDKDVIASIMNDNKIDTMVHLANSVDNDIDPYVTDSEMKRSKLCDKFIYAAAVSANVKNIVLLSTTQVYGLQKGREPIRETAPEKGITNYSEMKLTSEKYLTKAVKKSQTVGVIARVAPIYDAEYTQNLHDRVYDSKENVAYIFKEGEYAFSFCCIYNLIDFINGIINIPSGAYDGIYNVADSNAISAKEIIDYEKAHHRIGAVIQRNVGISFGVNKGKMKTDYRYFDPSTTFNNWYIDNTRAKRIAPLRWSLKNTK